MIMGMKFIQAHRKLKYSNKIFNIFRSYYNNLNPTKSVENLKFLEIKLEQKKKKKKTITNKYSKLYL